MTRDEAIEAEARAALEEPAGMYLVAHLADADGGGDSAVLWVGAFHRGFDLASGKVWNQR